MPEGLAYVSHARGWGKRNHPLPDQFSSVRAAKAAGFDDEHIVIPPSHDEPIGQLLEESFPTSWQFMASAPHDGCILLSDGFEIDAGWWNGYCFYNHDLYFTPKLWQPMPLTLEAEFKRHAQLSRVSAQNSDAG